MLNAVRHLPGFADRYACICDALGAVPEVEIGREPAYLDRNAVSSLLTVLVSSLSLDAYREQHRRDADFVAGYSVGQWTALYAAGCLPFDRLVGVIQQRAGLMDACVGEGGGAMMAVIGVSLDRIEAFCAELRAEGHDIAIGNYNCPGQYSLSGSTAAITTALARIQALSPKIVKRLPVSGAWHSQQLAAAAAAFHQYLDQVHLDLPSVPVVSDTTGAPHAGEIGQLKATLARHICSPVRWEDCIRGLLAQGCATFVELGFGSTLSKFGFFIDRSVAHEAFLAGRARPS